jgi:hypothetical protein
VKQTLVAVKCWIREKTQKLSGIGTDPDHEKDVIISRRRDGIDRQFLITIVVTEKKRLSG